MTWVHDATAEHPTLALDYTDDGDAARREVAATADQRAPVEAWARGLVEYLRRHPPPGGAPVLGRDFTVGSGC